MISRPPAATIAAGVSFFPGWGFAMGNRSTIVLVVGIVVVAGALFAVNFVLWTPPNPTGPPPGFELPAPGQGERPPPVAAGPGEGSSAMVAPRDTTYDGTPEQIARDAAKQRPVQYDPARPPTATEAKAF